MSALIIAFQTSKFDFLMRIFLKKKVQCLEFITLSEKKLSLSKAKVKAEALSLVFRTTLRRRSRCVCVNKNRFCLWEWYSENSKKRILRSTIHGWWKYFFQKKIRSPATIKTWLKGKNLFVFWMALRRRVFLVCSFSEF